MYVLGRETRPSGFDPVRHHSSRNLRAPTAAGSEVDHGQGAKSPASRKLGADVVVDIDILPVPRHGF